MDTITLSAAPVHVGQSVHFIAAVQQVAKGKRVLVAHQRVQVCHILHVGDASRQFFKVICWGETQPTFRHSSSSSEDSNTTLLSSVDAVIQVKDIVLFSSCCIKSYRGNVEAHFILRKKESALSSTVQLLYRKDRYFGTRNVSLKDLYPVIEWYKQHCRNFTMGDGGTPRGKMNKLTIKDLKDNMVVSVVCKLQPIKENSEQVSDRKGAVASELNGVLLCKLIMFDSPRDVMTINLWDQHADKRFVARLLKHHGAIEIDEIVVSLQALSNRLFANTTPYTVFRLLEPADSKSIKLDQNFEKQFQAKTTHRGPTTFTTLEELEWCSFEGHASLKNVRVEQVCFDRFFGSESRVLPQFAPQLVERYCTGCDGTLLELSVGANHAQCRFKFCASKCKTHRDNTINAPCNWRYCPFSMILRDLRNERLHVEVDNQAIVLILANIEAHIVAESIYNEDQGNTLSHIDAAYAVASLLNALIDDANQTFEAQLWCSTRFLCDMKSQSTGSNHGTSHDEDRTAKKYRLISLTPSDSFLI